MAVSEYPEEAIREALVNALAHRNYEDATGRVMVEIFLDRIVISSPGCLLPGIKLAQLRKGTARPRSRNPLIITINHRLCRWSKLGFTLSVVIGGGINKTSLS